MAWTGLPQLVVVPFVPLLMKRIDVRLLAIAGFLIFGASCFMNLNLDRNYASPQLFWPDVVRAVGTAIVFTPLSAIAMVGIAKAEAGAASGIFNMMRNLGGAVGVAAIETFLTRREHFHSFIINANVSLVDPATRSRLVGSSALFHGPWLPERHGSMAPGSDRDRPCDPRASHDHGLCGLLRAPRRSPVRRRLAGHAVAQGRKPWRRGALT